ncbi:hypothetical protein C1H46_013783 [Malus baccata]|uniref:Uncharacterized protein n=1 Tax=Malus baccata TaxID=106549 RepID=A0A540MP38_MALBA|nr:hypothetical protein C1H46_013783 [Malus baccata]
MNNTTRKGRDSEKVVVVNTRAGRNIGTLHTISKYHNNSRFGSVKSERRAGEKSKKQLKIPQQFAVWKWLQIKAEMSKWEHRWG